MPEIISDVLGELRSIVDDAEDMARCRASRQLVKEAREAVNVLARELLGRGLVDVSVSRDDEDVLDAIWSHWERTGGAPISPSDLLPGMRSPVGRTVARLLSRKEVA